MARLWEIDVLRTAAIVMMVVYHAAYDVEMLAPDVGPQVFDGGWKVLQVCCASTFLTVVGVAAWVRFARARARGIPPVTAWRNDAPRGGQVLAGAAAVSLGTFLALGSEDMVRFGILHLIALAVLVVLPVAVRFGLVPNLLLGAAFVAGGVVLDEHPTDVGALMVLGWDPGETGVDWVPVIPWLGVPLLGVALGALLYPGGDRGPLARRLAVAPARADRLGAPGRRSLTIYLVHQPVLVALTALVLLALGQDVDGL